LLFYTHQQTLFYTLEEEEIRRSLCVLYFPKKFHDRIKEQVCDVQNIAPCLQAGFIYHHKVTKYSATNSWEIWRVVT
jgi:hypothetical protein